MDTQYFNLDNWDGLSSMYSSDEVWKIKEIQYLIDNEYNFVKKGDIWHAIKNIYLLGDKGALFIKKSRVI